MGFRVFLLGSLAVFTPRTSPQGSASRGVRAWKSWTNIAKGQHPASYRGECLGVREVGWAWSWGWDAGSVGAWLKFGLGRGESPGPWRREVGWAWSWVRVSSFNGLKQLRKVTTSFPRTSGKKGPSSSQLADQ